MQEHANPWKQYLILMIGGILSFVAYKISAYYGPKDIQTILTYTFDYYSTHVYLRIFILCFIDAVILALFILFVWKMIELIKAYRNKRKTVTNYISPEEYEKQAKEWTNKELEKLQNSESYKEHIKNRAGAPKNWQEAERIEREKQFKIGEASNIILQSNLQASSAH